MTRIIRPLKLINFTRGGLFIFLALSHVSPASGVQDLKDVALKSMWTSATTNELQMAVNKLTHLQKLRIQCRTQLKNDRIPSKCFEVLEIENKSSLIPLLTSESHKKWLITICRARARSSKDWQELAATKDAKYLPNECLSDANQRLSDLQYQAESDNPDRLFDFRLSPHLKNLGPKFE